jgi:hypothetical protein
MRVLASATDSSNHLVPLPARDGPGGSRSGDRQRRKYALRITDQVTFWRDLAGKRSRRDGRWIEPTNSIQPSLRGKKRMSMARSYRESGGVQLPATNCPTCRHLHGSVMSECR